MTNTTASIGLAQLDAVTKRLYDALPASPNDAPDDSRELWYIHEDLRQLARRSLTSGAPAVLEFVQAVAHNFDCYDSGDDERSCRGCSALIGEDGSANHLPDCIVPRAKAYLAAPIQAGAAAKTEQTPYFRDIEFDPPAGLFTTASSLDLSDSATAAGAGSELPDERALFQRETLRLDILDDEGTWAGANSPDGWYYFDDAVNGCWKTWQARAALAKQADAGVSQQAGVHAGELADERALMEASCAKRYSDGDQKHTSILMRLSTERDAYRAGWKDRAELAQQGAAQATSTSVSEEAVLLVPQRADGSFMFGSACPDRSWFASDKEIMESGMRLIEFAPRSPAPSQAAPLEAQAGAEKGGAA